MKKCIYCQAELADEATFCARCGAPVAAAPAPEAAANPNPNPAPAPNPQQPYYAPPAYVDPTDHTAEFDPKDISDNKVIAMLVYLVGGVLGAIVAALLAPASDYVKFHVRQSLKLTVCSLLIPLVMALSCVLAIIPILGWLVIGLVFLVGGVLMMVLSVVSIVCFFHVCKGKAKEAPIVKGLNFLK